MSYSKEEKLLIRLSRLSDLSVPPIDNDINSEKLLLLASNNGLLNFIHFKLRDSPYFKKSFERFLPLINSSRLATIGRHMEFDFLTEKFKDAKIPFIPIKGMFLARTVYPSKETRDMLDIDILARYEDASMINALLKGLRYEQVYADSSIEEDLLPLLSDRRLREYIDCVEFKRSDSTLEIHFKMLTSKIFTQIPPERIWEDAVKTVIDGRELLVLSPEHQLINVATHCMKHNLGFGLRPLAEIDALIAFYGKKIDWDFFLKDVTDYDLSSLTYTPLLLSQKLYDSPVPDYAINSLRMHIHPDMEKISQTIADSFFQRGAIPRLNDDTYLFHIVAQKRRFRSLYNILFPPIKLLRLKNRGIMARRPFIYAQYPLRLFHLVRSYLPGILRNRLYDK